jgi:hypothetical protein
MHERTRRMLMSNTADRPTISMMDAGRGTSHDAGRLRRAALGLAAAGLLALAPAASAAETGELLPMGSGLTHPAGIAEDNGGHVWVADPLMGVCRVDRALGGLVEDGAWCAPVVEVDDEDETAPPVAPTRPEEAFQMAYDPASSKLFVAEGTSGSSGVWRLDVDAVAGRITGGSKILNEADRVFALALGDEGGTPVLDYGLKRTPLIKRIVNPATCSPCESVGSGSALAEEPLGLAFLNGSLYVAEATGITKIADAGALGGVAVPIANFPGGVPSAIAADPVNNRVYAGTNNGNNQDQVDVLDPATGAVENYVSGLVGVKALGVGAGGRLLIAEDPDLGPEQVGNGRVLSAGLAGLGLPAAAITSRPAVFSNGDSASFSFTGPAGSTFLCRQDPSELTPWTPCGAGGVGSVSFGSLGEGVHVLEVRAISPDPLTGAGPVQRHTFVIDRTAPGVQIDNDGVDREITGNAITMRFSSAEVGLAFACAIDGQAPAPCSDPIRYEGLAPGAHTFAVTATDAAGNSSAPVVWDFTTRGAVAPSRDDDRGRPAVGVGEASRVFGRLPSLSVALRPRSVRLITARRTVAKLRRSRRLVTQVRVPATARWATIALWRTNKRSVRSGRRPIAFAAVRLLKSGRNDVVLTLTRRQARSLRAGRYLVGVVLTDGADRVGPARYRRLTVLR